MRAGRSRSARGAVTTRLITRQLRDYLGHIGWIAADAVHRWPGRIVVVTLLNLLGIAATVATFGGLILYARHLEAGDDPLRLLGLEVTLRDDPTFLAAYAALIAGVGLLAGAAVYYGEWFIARLTMRYQHRCTARLLRIAADPGFRGWAALLDPPARLAISRMAGIPLRLTAFAFRNMLQAILPACTFVVAAIVLVAVDPWLTLLLVPILAVYLVPLYFVNRGVARLHKAYMSTAPDARRNLSEGWRLLVDTGATPERKAEWIERDFDRDAQQTSALLFWKRKLSVARVQWVNTSFFVLCLIGLFIYFGVETQRGDRTWAEFLAFVVALRFAFGGVRQTTANFIKLSRFLPEYRAYIDFVEDAEAMKRERLASPQREEPLPDPIVIRCGRGGLWESAARLRIPRGGVVWILTADDPSEAELDALAVTLEEHAREEIDLLSRAAVHARPRFERHLTLAENALGPEPDERDLASLREWLASFGVLDEIDSLPDGLDATADEEALSTLSLAARGAILAAPLRESGEVRIVAAHEISGVEPEAASGALACEGLLVLVAADPDDVFDPTFEALNESAAGAIVLESRSIIAAGDLAWLESRAPEIRANLQRARVEAGGDVEEEEELELEEA